MAKELIIPPNFGKCRKGGIDSKEKSEVAALREMEEEVGIKENKVELLTESQDWYYYSIPKDLAQTLWKGKYKGQTSKSGFYINLRELIEISIFTQSIRSSQITSGLQKISWCPILFLLKRKFTKNF